MRIFEEFQGIVERFETEGVAYALVGGVALAFHGLPRFTQAIDIRKSAIARHDRKTPLQ